MGILLLGQYCCLRTKLKAFLEVLDLGFPCHKGSQWPQKSLNPSPSFRPHSISQSQTRENSRGTLVLKTSQSALGGWQHGHPLAACWKRRMSGPAQAYWLAKKRFLVTCLHVNVWEALLWMKSFSLSCTLESPGSCLETWMPRPHPQTDNMHVSGVEA